MSSTAQMARISTDVPGIGFGRLVALEARKSFNTRAGRWLSYVILAIVVLVVLVMSLLVPDGGVPIFQLYLQAAGGVLGYFLPIIPIMLLTQEWGQRTGLVTFTLEPRRLRVILAKLVASLLISVGVMAIAFALAGLGTMLAGLRGTQTDWTLPSSAVFNYVLANAIGVLIGFAIAMLLMNTAASIVTYFIYTLVVPTVAQIAGALISWLGPIIPWIEFNAAQQPLFSEDFSMTGEQWAQLATSGFIWLVVPFALGLWRLLRAEVK